MKLNSVKLPVVVADCRTRAFFRVCNDGKPVGRYFYAVGMTHPANAFARNFLKQNIILRKYGSLSVFAAVLGRVYCSPCHIRHELCAVANTEYRYPGIEYCRVIVR